MVAVIFFAVMALSLVVALAARAGLKNKSMGEYLVGGRSFPAWLLYFLAVGEVYSIGTMIGLPSGIYSGGAGYGVWFVGYILMAYPIGYFLAPLIWRAGVRYDAMTIPDVFGKHYASRSLEIVTAIVLLLALVPWGQYQFIGLQVVLDGLGLNLSPEASVIIAGVLAFAYLLASGVRSPAFVSILKDSVMVLSVIVVGLVAVAEAGGTFKTFDTAGVSKAMTTLSGDPLMFTVTTIVFQSITFYLGFSAGFVFTSRSERAIKSSTVWMPMYMLIYPFIFLASFYAVTQMDGIDDPNTVFMDVTLELLPDWLVGVVAAGAGLSGVLVLSVTALQIGGVVTRNLIPNVRSELQRTVSNVVVALFLVAGALLTLAGSSIMLTVLNLTYYLLGQLVPGWLALMFFRRIQAWAVSAGMIAGFAASLLIYNLEPDLAGVNGGLVAVAVNFLLVFGISAIAPGQERVPMARWQYPHRDGAHRPPAAVPAAAAREVD